MNGVTITNAYPILFAAGGGFYIAVGAGVLIKNGVTYAQFNGPAYLVLRIKRLEARAIAAAAAVIGGGGDGL